MASNRANNYHPIDRPDWLTTEAWPYEVKSAHIDGKTTLAYTDEGSGPSVLLVHDGMNSYIWGQLIGRLADRFRVVTPPDLQWPT